MKIDDFREKLYEEIERQRRRLDEKLRISEKEIKAAEIARKNLENDFQQLKQYIPLEIDISLYKMDLGSSKKARWIAQEGHEKKLMNTPQILKAIIKIGTLSKILLTL